MSTFEPWLNSAETGEAFTHCIHCKLPLLEIDSTWLINKDFHKGECTLEYAICDGCRELTSEDFSEDSKKAVRNFLENEIPWDERLQKFVLHPLSRMENCVACNCPRELAEDYATSILMDSAGEIHFGPLPLLICGGCIELMSERLSQSTRDSWRRFLEEHFDYPPQLSSLPGLL
ncbi:MAG: hypothetical protein ACO3SO_08795 [Luteolibacter sp.]